MLARIEHHYNNKINTIKYLSNGDNGSVSLIEFQDSTKICVKSISLQNNSAQTDFEIAALVYDQFNVISYTEDNCLHYSMPYFSGSSLEQMIKERDKFDLNTRLAIFSKLLSAIDAIHRKGVIHRDLKAANIIVTMGSNIMVNVIDFGRSVRIFDSQGKPIATPEDLSLIKTNSYSSFSFFHPIIQLIRKTQKQTAPEYTSLSSHLKNFTDENIVGFRSDYYSVAKLFQEWVPEFKTYADSVITTTGMQRNFAFQEFRSQIANLTSHHANEGALQQDKGDDNDDKCLKIKV